MGTCARDALTPARARPKREVSHIEVYIELSASTVGALLGALSKFPPDAALLITDGVGPRLTVAVVTASNEAGPVTIWADYGTD